MDQPEVVVIGAGIAGGALAAVLARSGKRVLVLERTLEHEDRVSTCTRGAWPRCTASASTTR